MLQITFCCGPTVDADLVSDILLGLGAYSVEVTDRNAGTAREQFIFHEPLPDGPNFLESGSKDKKLWHDAVVSASFPQDTNMEQITMALFADFDLPQTPHFHIIRAGPVPEPILTKDWASHVQRNFSEIVIGNIVVQAPWHEQAQKGSVIPRDRLKLLLEPGMSFGTGEHPTTQLVLQWLQGFASNSKTKSRRAWRVLDYGCGSGILSIASVLLGASTAFGCDIDPLAVKTAAENVRRNCCSDRVILGSNKEEQEYFTQNIASGYEVVVANILAGPLKSLARLLVERIVHGGSIALSGILIEQAQEVSDTYSSLGLEMQHAAVKCGWALLVGTKVATP